MVYSCEILLLVLKFYMIQDKYIHMLLRGVRSSLSVKVPSSPGYSMIQRKKIKNLNLIQSYSKNPQLLSYRSLRKYPESFGCLSFSSSLPWAPFIDYYYYAEPLNWPSIIAQASHHPRLIGKCSQHSRGLFA